VRPSRSIRTRLFVALMAMTLLTLVFATGLSAVMGLKLFRDHMLRDLEVLAAVVGQNCVAALTFDSPESAGRNLATLAREYQVERATLLDAEGEPFALWRRPAVTGSPGLDWRAEIVHPLELDGQPLGRLVLEVRLAELERQIRLYVAVAAVLVTATLALALLVALWLQRRLARPVLELVEAARSVGARQDFSVRVRVPRAEREIGTLVISFNQMLAQIEQREADLDRANAALRQLAKELSLLEENEKARLSTELHDGPMQRLSLAQMRFQLSAAAAGETADPKANQDMQAGIELLREAIAELRTLQFALSPPVLHQRGLGAALDWLAGDTRERHGIALRCMLADELPELDRDTAVMLFQCARELVYNMIKHAGAESGTMALAMDADGLRLTVEDDGRGFAADGDGAGRPESGGGYGLYSVRERLKLLDGSLEVSSPTREDGRGARLIIRLPLPDRPRDSAAVSANQ